MDERNFMTLTDEDGNDVEFEHLDTVEYNDRTYFAFKPVDLTEEEELAFEPLIMVLEVEDEEEFLVPVADDEEYDTLYQIFAERFDELFFGEEDDAE